MPASAVATYELPDGLWEYLRAEITSIERFEESRVAGPFAAWREDAVG